MHNQNDNKLRLNIGIASFFMFVAVITIPVTSYARSGCCSHHGGVGTCGCNDGTPFSATCAPYYPSCTEPKRLLPTTPQLQVNPTPPPVIPEPKKEEAKVNNQAVTSVSQSNQTTDNERDGVGAIWKILGIGFLIAVIGYFLYEYYL
ncbi:hypothetical protein HYV44_03700 [Candidatus Microgenomates bacterium]|nr:hypothetical protein [Candidatus Microgenomates bacterium]